MIANRSAADTPPEGTPSAAPGSGISGFGICGIDMSSGTFTRQADRTTLIRLTCPASCGRREHRPSPFGHRTIGAASSSPTGRRNQISHDPIRRRGTRKTSTSWGSDKHKDKTPFPTRFSWEYSQRKTTAAQWIMTDVSRCINSLRQRPRSTPRAGSALAVRSHRESVESTPHPGQRDPPGSIPHSAFLGRSGRHRHTPS